MEVIQVETPVSAKEFKKHFGEKKHALVAYLAPWCGHCKEFKPEWRELSKRMKGSKRRGMLAAVSEEFIDAGQGSRHLACDVSDMVDAEPELGVGIGYQRDLARTKS